MTTSAPTRFSAESRCPVCGGWDRMPRGQGIRCSGYLGSDRKYAHCSREENAGGLPQENRGTFAHRLGGPCRCGKTHASNGAPAPEILERRFPAIDANGKTIAIHVRLDTPQGKRVWWELADGTKGLRGIRLSTLPLYGLPDLLAAPEGSAVVLVEGEGKCDGLTRRGLLAVGTMTGAATIPDASVLAPLAKHRPYLWRDNDPEGLKHMDGIAARLHEMGVAARIIDWAASPPKGDAADYFQGGGTVAGVHALMAAAAEWTHEGSEEARTCAAATAPIDTEEEDEDRPSEDWPAFPACAWRGSAALWRDWQRGTTEAPEAYHFAAWLVVSGLAIGRGAWVECGGILYPQFMAAIVGPPGRARKSTVIARAASVARDLCPELVTLRGWGSGEGCLKAIAAQRKTEPLILLCQSEMMVMLRKMLSVREAVGGGVALLNELYDGADENVQNATAEGSVTIERPLLSLLGGVTPENAGRLYGEGSIETGLASRFVPFLGRPSVRLARPPLPSAEKRRELALHLEKMARQAAATNGEFPLTMDAEVLHAKWYATLPDEDDASSRIGPHVLRLALVFAVDRESTAIEVEDLLPAIEVGNYWREVADTIRQRWGGGKIHHMQDRILSKLQGDGLTLRDLKNKLGGSRLNRTTFDSAWEALQRSRAVKLDAAAKRWITT